MSMLTGADIDMIRETAFARGVAKGRADMHTIMTEGADADAGRQAVAQAADAASRGVINEAVKHLPEASAAVLKALLGLLGQ